MSDESGVGYFELGMTASVNPDGTIREEDAGAVSEIFEAWLATGSGREFREKFNSRENFDKISRAIGALGKFLSVAEVDQTYADLRDSNSLLPTPPSAAELGQLQRRRRETEFEAFHAAASTSEEKELAAKSKKYDAWLKRRIDGETAHPDSLPPTKADRSDESLVQFADSYRRMLARDVASKMRDPEFAAQVEACIEKGLL